jgi:broad specificity phosphatase PhoE
MRAVQTADIIRKFHPDVLYSKIPEINERSKGPAEGMKKEEFNNKYPEIVKQWEKGIDARPEGGENFEDVDKRVIPVIELHIKEDTESSNFLYVTHGNVIKVIIGHVLKIPFSRQGSIKQDYCSLSSITYDHEKNRWEVEFINKVFWQ